MKLRCGWTQEQIDAAIVAERMRQEARETWHTTYAWLPVSVARGCCRWLEHVERKQVVVCGEACWRYREVGKGDGYVRQGFRIPWPEIMIVLACIAALYPW